MLKGKTIIELKNAVTGEVEKYEDENMVTTPAGSAGVGAAEAAAGPSGAPAFLPAAWVFRCRMSAEEKLKALPQPPHS